LTTPAGWDVFQSAGAEKGGTIVWEMKAAAALGTSVGQLDYSGNTYTVVTPGTFPTLTPYRYARWRISIVSDADAVPTVTSVVVNWFVAQVTSLRAASLFFNKTYFLAVAEAGSSTNNIVLAYDWQNNWRKRDDLTINTFGFFFNDPYYGSAASGQLVRWQLGVTNADESNVALDIRTKGYDFGDDTHRKVLRKVFTTLGNTGATWAFTYSLDMGQTWLPLYDDTGATSVTTPPDGIENTHHRWVPAAADLTGAAHIMLRGRSSDAHAAELHEMHVDVVIREGEILA
jgi:hypothetical protein